MGNPQLEIRQKVWRHDVFALPGDRSAVPADARIYGYVAAEGRGVVRGVGCEPEEFLQTRLVADMLPLSYQLKSVAVHSKGAIAGVRRGSFRPDTAKPPSGFQTLKKRLEDARTEIDALTLEEVESFVGRKMLFAVRFGAREFTADRFLLSFSQPNFYFHVTAAYALMRMRGVEIGKRDYLGTLQTEKPGWQKIAKRPV